LRQVAPYIQQTVLNRQGPARKKKRNIEESSMVFRLLEQYRQKYVTITPGGGMV
jgi:hypothetical protein